jgi:hypothetical protein
MNMICTSVQMFELSKCRDMVTPILPFSLQTNRSIGGKLSLQFNNDSFLHKNQISTRYVSLAIVHVKGNILVTNRQVCLLSAILCHVQRKHLMTADEACYSQGQEYSFAFSLSSNVSCIFLKI